MSQQLVTAREVLPGRAEPIVDGAVLVDGATITAVGHRPDIEAQAEPNATRLDFPDGTLLAGLIDAHVHLAFDAGTEVIESLRSLDDDALVETMATRARTLVDNGVTTVRDLGDRGGTALRVRDAVARGDLIGPRILAAGPPLTVSGGHCWFLGGEVEGAAGIRKQIEWLVNHGVDVIKVMASGGHITPNSPKPWERQFTMDELRVVVDEAAAAGLPVAAHAHGTGAIEAAVEVGVDTIEHCTWMRLGDNEPLEERMDIAERMAARGIYACPAWPSDWRALLEALGQEVGDRAMGNVRNTVAAGVTLIAGTDAGVTRSEHGGTAAALEFYQHAGLPTKQILDMATVDSAEALGIGDHVGRLAAGFSADMLVTGSDPRNDVRALRDQQLVMARGDVIAQT